jgi:hydrogenase maturation protease
VRPVRLYVLGEANRGDDGAAFLAAGLLEARGALPADVVPAGQLGPDSFVDLPAGTAVVVADAVVGVPPGTVVTRPLAEVATGGGAAPRSSHVMPLQQVLALAGILGGLPEGVFVGIGAASFELGAPPSPAVRAALPSFAAAIAREVERLAGATPVGRGRRGEP